MIGGRGLRPRSFSRGASSKRPTRALPSPPAGATGPRRAHAAASAVSRRGRFLPVMPLHLAGFLVDDLDVTPAELEDAPANVAGIADGDDVSEFRQLTEERLLWQAAFPVPPESTMPWLSRVS